MKDYQEISNLIDLKYIRNHENQMDRKDFNSKFDTKFKNINKIIQKIEGKKFKNNGYKDFDIENMNEIRLKNGQLYQIEIDNLIKRVVYIQFMKF